MARSPETRISSVQLEIVSILTAYGAMGVKQIQAHLPTIHPKPLKAHLDTLIGLKRLRGVQCGTWGRRYAVNFPARQEPKPRVPNEQTVITQPKRAKMKGSASSSWWVCASDEQFTAAARDRARQMSWND